MPDASPTNLLKSALPAWSDLRTMAQALPRGWWIASAGLGLLFFGPLRELLGYSLHSDLHSHAPLMPLVAVYLIWINRHGLPTKETDRPRRWLAAFPFLGAAGVWATLMALRASGADLAQVDRLAFSTGAFLLAWLGITAVFIGPLTLRRVTFPLGLLVFSVPLPTPVVNQVESWLQHGSADVSYAMLRAAGTPVQRQDLVLHLPGISLEVAPECSGIHSSLALLICSLVAGALLLNRPWQRVVLAVAVIPLAFLRNGLRIFVIADLCVEHGPHMIHSFIHRSGGPIFFALSLIPFGLLLWALTRANRSSNPSHESGSPPPETGPAASKSAA